MFIHQKIFALSLLIVAFLLNSCQIGPSIVGSKNIVETEYSIKDFSALDISSTFKTEIIQSDEFRVVISYNENLKEHLKIKKSAETLKIGLKSLRGLKNAKLSAKVYMPTLERVQISGACQVSIPNFNCKNLDLDFSGASGLYANIRVENELNIEGSGASIVDLEGTTKHANIDFSGASKLKAKRLIVEQNLEVDCSGASIITLTANGKMNLDLSGASAFYYYGSGQIMKQNLSGVSSIKRKS